MISKGKYIGISQRIPFDVLDSAIAVYLLEEEVEKDYILQRIQEYTKGANRAAKAASCVVQILSRQKWVLAHLKKISKVNPYTQLREDDRKALCLCLICLTYPIIYDVLVAMSQGFKVQPQINKKFISEKVMSIYGSNRSVDIAIDALLPMIIELNTIKRDKMSIYSLGSKLQVTNNFIAEMVIYADVKSSGSKSLLVEDLEFRPWFSFFELPPNVAEVPSILLTKKETALNKGYLTI